MKSMQRRLDSLTSKLGPDEDTITVFIREFVQPGPDGPEDAGYARAVIIDGRGQCRRLECLPDESKASFEMRVSKAACVK